MKNGRNAIKIAVPLLALLCVGFVLLMSGISLPNFVTGFNGYFSPTENAEYKIDPEELTVPAVPAYSPLEYEETPIIRTPLDPGFSLKTSYTTAEFFQGGVGYVKVNVMNDGGNSIFIERFGIAVNSSKNPVYTKDTGTLLLPGEEKSLGLVAVQLPEGKASPSMQIVLWLLAKTSTGRWHEYPGPQYLKEFTIEASPMPDKINPLYISNPLPFFKTFNGLVNSSDPEIRKTAAEAARVYGGAYNIYQVCTLFDRVNKDIEYISDPRGNDIWEPANITLKTGAGDCEDQAILLAALIETIGGTTRLYLTDTHAFAAVYIGNETAEVEKVVKGIRAYYGNADVHYLTDEYGSWLMLDPTSSLYAGGLPGTTAQVCTAGPEGNTKSWTFLNTSEVKVIDISSIQAS